MNYKIALMLAFAAASANSTNATEERDPSGYYTLVTRLLRSSIQSAKSDHSTTAMRRTKSINDNRNVLGRFSLNQALGLGNIREIDDQTAISRVISNAFHFLNSNPSYTQITGSAGSITLDDLARLTGCGIANDWISTLASKGVVTNGRLPDSGYSVQALKTVINASGTSYHLASEIMEKLAEIAVRVHSDFDAAKGMIQITGIPAAPGQTTTQAIDKNLIAKAVEQHIHAAISTAFDKFKNLLDNSSVFVSQPQVKKAADIETILRSFNHRNQSINNAAGLLVNEGAIDNAITAYNNYVANGGPEAVAGSRSRQAIMMRAIYGDRDLAPAQLPRQLSGGDAAHSIDALTDVDMLALLPVAKSLNPSAEEIRLDRQIKGQVKDIKKGQQVRLLTADFIQDKVINKARELPYNANNALPFINNMLTNLETISSRGDFKSQEDMNNAINTLNKIEKNASNPIGEFARTGEIFGVSFTSDAIKSAQADLSDKIKAARDKLSVKAKALGLSMDPAAPNPAGAAAPAADAVKINKDMKLPEAKKLIDSASLENKIDEEVGLNPSILNVIKGHNSNVETLNSFKIALLSSFDDNTDTMTLNSFKKLLLESKLAPKLKVALRNPKFFQAVTKAIGSIEDNEAFKKSVTNYVTDLKKPDTQSPRKKSGGKFVRRTGKRAQQVKGGKRAQQVKGGKRAQQVKGVKRAQQVKGGKRAQQVKGGKRAQAEANNPVQAKKAAAA